MNHPSSAGLRKLADFLDGCVEEVGPAMLVLFSVYEAGGKERQQVACADLCKRLGKTPTAPKEKWQDASIKADFDGVSAEFGFKPEYVLEEVIEMKPVKSWKSAQVEVKAKDAA